jgi:hypothetical protein
MPKNKNVMMMLGSKAAAPIGGNAVIDYGTATKTTSGLYTIYTYNTSSNFQLASGSLTIDYLVVGGGGYGWDSGGGAGGMLTGSLPLAVQNYAVIVGLGSTVYNVNGGNSQIGSSIISYGGGSYGAGGGSGSGGIGAAGGAGVAGQGYAGGAGDNDYISWTFVPAFGGGGGAGGVGGHGTNGSNGTGGPGRTSNISGSNVTYAAGGGAGSVNAAHSGNGGYATASGNGYGDDGIVIIRVLTSDLATNPFFATGGQKGTSGLYTVHTFLANDTFTVIGGSKAMEYMVVAGGGSAGIGNGQNGALIDVGTALISTSGAYTIFKYNSSSNFNVVSGSLPIEYLVIGGGGTSDGAGGGAGGFLTGTTTLNNTNYAIIVGGSGGNSQIGASLIAYGGGNASGGSGGSGAGGYGVAGGSGVAGQGYAGAAGSTTYYNWSYQYTAGGGGGAGGAGSTNGTGGPGRTSSITGTSIMYSVGGSASGSNYILNSGNGASADDYFVGGSSGVVIIKVLTSLFVPLGFYAQGGTKTIVGNYTVHTFNSNGTFLTQGRSKSIEYFLVGGGGGGAYNMGGGGGGQAVTFTNPSMPVGSYPVVIGGGGNSPYDYTVQIGNSAYGSPTYGTVPVDGTNGSPSTFDSHTANGGIAGSGINGGASGGGYAGGSGSYYFDGYNNQWYNGGGGGGAGGNGGNSPNYSISGSGGSGVVNNWLGSNITYGAGATGSSATNLSYIYGVYGYPNTGGGSSINRYTTTQQNRPGGSGIVLVRYLTNEYPLENMQTDGTEGGGGGGAGGLVLASGTIGIGTYPVVIGQGGIGASIPSAGNNGGNSSFNGTIAYGGGGGGANSYVVDGVCNGKNGGSGGGAGASRSATPTTGGTKTIGQGSNGGDSTGYAGGGGGAGAVGTSGGSSNLQAAGGAGLVNAYTGSNVTYATGGDSSGASLTHGIVGTPNTGNGASASNMDRVSPIGGSGIVIIRYLT